MISTITIYTLAIVLLIISLKKSKSKTKQVLQMSFKKMLGMLPSLLPVIILIGIILSLLPTEFISNLVGENSGTGGILFGLGIGSISFLPSFVVYPFGARLVDNGAGILPVAAFVASMMSVSIITLSMEIEYFGKKVSILRNVMGLIAAILFVIILSLTL